MNDYIYGLITGIIICLVEDLIFSFWYDKNCYKWCKKHKKGGE